MKMARLASRTVVLPLFRNFDENGEPLPRPRTLLIDSEQLESGEALDDTFRSAASDEIERFRREIVERTRRTGQAKTYLTARFCAT